MLSGSAKVAAITLPSGENLILVVESTVQIPAFNRTPMNFSDDDNPEMVKTDCASVLSSMTLNSALSGNGSLKSEDIPWIAMN